MTELEQDKRVEVKNISEALTITAERNLNRPEGTVFARIIVDNDPVVLALLAAMTRKRGFIIMGSPEELKAFYHGNEMSSLKNDF